MCYVGYTTKTLDERIKRHIKRMKRKSRYDFHIALNQYGLDNFQWEVIKEYIPKHALDMIETFMIIVHKAHKSENGYNMTWGGDDNPMNNPKCREKLSESIKKRYADPEFRKKMLEAHKGMHHTEETKKKISETLKGKKRAPFTEEHKRKISEAMKGKKNRCQKVSEVHFSTSINPATIT